MDYLEFREKFSLHYGSGLWQSAVAMGINDSYLSITNKWADEIGKPQTEFILSGFSRGATATIEDCIEDCHTELLRVVKETFFGRLSRESAVALCNTLSIADSKIAICEGEPDFQLDADRVAFESNRFHPDEKITKNNIDYIV
mgnify:CR=1 FL=1